MRNYLRKAYESWIDYPRREGSRLAGGEYRIVRFLGAGSYGLTYLCEHRTTGEQAVVKQAKPSKGRLGAELLQREAEVMALMSHPRIPKLVGTVAAGKHAYLIMEYVEGDTVEDLIFERGLNFTERTSLQVLRELMDIVAYVHGQGFVHLDIRIPNVIWKGNDLHLIDFGLAKRIGAHFVPERGMDEELVRRRTPTLSSDYYALGHFLLYLLYSSYPSADSDTQESASEGDDWEKELALSAGTTSLLRKLLQRDAPYDCDKTLLQDLRQSIQELE
jgi:serine/threonine protein kinase, bacterial